MYPLERPYKNLFFHKECFNEISTEIIQYLSVNLDRIYNYGVENRKNNGKKTTIESTNEEPIPV